MIVTTEALSDAIKVLHGAIDRVEMESGYHCHLGPIGKSAAIAKLYRAINYLLDGKRKKEK
jgi:hypothetical protein